MEFDNVLGLRWVVVGCKPEEAYYDKRWKEQTADAEAAAATKGCLRTHSPDIGEAFHLDIRYRRRTKIGNVTLSVGIYTLAAACWLHVSEAKSVGN